ncbi:MAG TPA: ferritin-like domain-containing protein [Bdellovibrionota bacterium]|nr:ferritin-like domain-containing protein [Bdellovibrionota bacterium]
MTPDWSPFSLTPAGERGDPPRSIDTIEGRGDRMRTAAFAELQARHAFLWGAERFTEVPEALRQAWRSLAAAEDRHLNWLLQRMAALGISITERRVSDQLWKTLTSCKSACEFAIYMATAEERGRRAGERFAVAMKSRDPESAVIFGKIAEEEVAHIVLAERFFPAEFRAERSLSELARGLH